MSDRAIVLAQARMAILVALRTPRTIIFTIAFPVVLLVLFNSIFSAGGNETTTLPSDVKLGAEAYFTAGIIARLFTYLGWGGDWDRARVRDLPDHMLQGVPRGSDLADNPAQNTRLEE